MYIFYKWGAISTENFAPFRSVNSGGSRPDRHSILKREKEKRELQKTSGNKEGKVLDRG